MFSSRTCCEWKVGLAVAVGFLLRCLGIPPDKKGEIKRQSKTIIPAVDGGGLNKEDPKVGIKVEFASRFESGGTGKGMRQIQVGFHHNLV